MTGRWVGLDHLRGLAVVGVFLLHWCAAYMRHAPGWWFVRDPDGGLGFTVLAVLLDATVIPLLFTLAGYVSREPLTRLGPATFLRRRVRRLGPPWVAGVIFGVPCTTWLWARSRDLPGLGWEAGMPLTWNPPQGVYWFVGVLLAFGACAAILSRLEGHSAPGSASNVPFPLHALLVPAGFAAGTAIFVPLDEWRQPALLAFQPARLPVYACCYALGLWGWRHGWRPSPAVPGRVGVSAAGLLLAVAAFLALRAHPAPGVGGRVPLAFAYAAVAGLFVRVSLELAPLLDRPRSRVLASLSRHGFAIYLLHLPPLLLFTMWARDLPLPLLPRALGVGVAAFAVTWAVAAGWAAVVPERTGRHRPLAASDNPAFPRNTSAGASPPPLGAP